MGKVKGVVLLFSLLLACQQQGVARDRVTLEQIRGYAFPDNLVAARDGSHLAWTVDDHGRKNIWVASGPDFKARQLTAYADDDGQELSSVSLTDDGSHVVYVRGGDHGANWDRTVPTNPTSVPSGNKVEVWSVAFADGAAHRLGEGDYPTVSPDGTRVVFLKEGAAWLVPVDGSDEAKKIIAIRGKVQSPRWSPDGKRLAFVAERETHSFVGIYSDPQTAIKWIAPAFSRDENPRWSPDGEQLAFIRRRGDGGAPMPLSQFELNPWAIWVADVAQGTGRQIWSSGHLHRDNYMDELFEWTGTGRIVYESYQDGWPHLYSIASAGGEPRRLTTGEFMVEHAILASDRTHVLFDANTGLEANDADRRHAYEVSADGGVIKTVTSGTGLEWAPVATGDGQIAFISATAQRPPALATVAPRHHEIRLFADQALVAAYPANQLVIPRSVSFQASDGRTVHGQLFQPTGPAASGKWPAIVYLHGGPSRQMLLGWHPMDYYSNDYALNQYLVSRGFVVLAVNYRLGIGYGQEFQFPPEAGRRGGAEYLDVKAGGLYLQGLPQVDANRIGIYGGSYGGYLTAMGLAHDSSSFKVGVDIHGVHDWTAREEVPFPYVRKRYETAPDVESAVAIAWKASPVSAVAEWKSPVLFIQGDDDRNVRFGQSVDLIRRLQEKGDVAIETLVFPDDTHDIQRYANEISMDAATAEFLERHLAKPH